MTKRFRLSSFANTRGFSLPEALLVVSVLAILVTLTMPAMIAFLKSKDIRQEQNTQVAIRTALSNAIAATGDLPSDTATGTDAWYNVLARYTNLSPAQIQMDTWNRPRTYVMLRNSQTMLNTTVNIFYVTLHSKGPDGRATAITDATLGTLIPVSGNDYAAVDGSTNWWKNKTPSPDAAIDAFTAVNPPSTSDDLSIRYTDYPEKVAAYNTTLDRMARIVDGLTNYANSKYAERSVACSVASPPADCTTYPPERQIHYPFATDGGTTTDVYTNYNATVISAIQAQNGNTTQYFYNGSDNVLRRTGMISLMRLLGLPDDYCCSALEQFTTSGTTRRQMPFHYFSNPRPRASDTACSARPTLTDTKLPARITTGNVADGQPGATCG